MRPALSLKNSGETLFTKAFRVVNHFGYEIYERFVQIFLYRIHVSLNEKSREWAVSLEFRT
ncbi:hypothetical protein D1609_08565 [Leptospira borgpetersenii serovar Hardjo-bovis]|uniref:hypothetical protein n=1 Tax=Leptospira borgpetersenii TaxID=174 RepID=UPI0003449943|nr:hypothetical protein [Leptospira borgpetersenii]AWV70110.1 hypothetical protein B9T54_08615 [Leptospira borgpetersenii serovar Hardjo-bovis]AYR08526.1 hypothetical protein D1609_08565 [Leptospira borgpetersenii serovar Hardjo-bovis]